MLQKNKKIIKKNSVVAVSKKRVFVALISLSAISLGTAFILLIFTSLCGNRKNSE